MKRIFAFLLSALMLLGILASCGEQPAVQPASSEAPESRSEEPRTEPGTESASDSETEEVPATEEPVSSKYETEYVAPEDGSFTVCGIPLSQYTLVLYIPAVTELANMNPADYKKRFNEITESAIGSELEIKVARNDKMFTDKRYEHEILFGTGFVRDGMPEPDMKKNCYGVTADGTIYFATPSIALYSYMYSLFLEEFFGIPADSGQRSAGCALTECYRELPGMDQATLEAKGYSLVFEDPFDGDTLNLDVWEHRGSGVRRSGINAPSQVTVSDGCLVLTGEHRDEGEYGEGWYSGMIALKEWYCRGYFEARIKCNETKGRGDPFWSAFWIQGPNPYDPEASYGGIGPGGCEIDIMETFGRDYFSSCIHCGVPEGIEVKTSSLAEVAFLGNDYSEEFHVFSLLWDEECYSFYIDGQLFSRNSHVLGTSTVKEQVILSLEIYKSISQNYDYHREMYVDYLKIWQKPEETPEA